MDVWGGALVSFPQEPFPCCFIILVKGTPWANMKPSNLGCRNEKTHHLRDEERDRRDRRPMCSLTLIETWRGLRCGRWISHKVENELEPHKTH